MGLPILVFVLLCFVVLLRREGAGSRSMSMYMQDLLFCHLPSNSSTRLVLYADRISAALPSHACIRLAHTSITSDHSHENRFGSVCPSPSRDVFHEFQLPHVLEECSAEPQLFCDHLSLPVVSLVDSFLSQACSSNMPQNSFWRSPYADRVALNKMFAMHEKVPIR